MDRWNKRGNEVGREYAEKHCRSEDIWRIRFPSQGHGDGVHSAAGVKQADLSFRSDPRKFRITFQVGCIAESHLPAFVPKLATITLEPLRRKFS